MLRELILISIIGFGIETITVMARLLLDKRSGEIERHIEIPRLRHSYFGFILLFFYFLWHQQWLLISGGALVFSDALHHFIVIPFLVHKKYDLGLLEHPRIHKLLQKHKKSLAILFIIIGLLALITPLTPGSWLVPMGFVMLIGRTRARSILAKLIGRQANKII